MLPPELASSYSQYKSDTNVFVTWLYKSAALCGYTSRLTRAEDEDEPIINATANFASTSAKGTVRLKGKERKEAKIVEAAKLKAEAMKPPERVVHSLPTRELLAQARVVANATTPKIMVPIMIQRLLSDAIQARKRCTAWFQKVNSGEKFKMNHDSNATHEHFIHILEAAWKLLQARFEVPKQTRQASGVNVTQDTSSGQLESRFNGLHVEDLDIEEYDALPSVTPTSRPTELKKGQQDVYELELALEAELPFIIYCFFEDLNQLRKFLNRVWEQVKDGSLSYMSASLTTNIALELVEKSEDSLISLSPERFGKTVYRSITSVIHDIPKYPTLNLETLLAVKQRGEVSEDHATSQNTFRHDEFVFLQTFLTLEKFRTQAMFNKKEAMTQILSPEIYWFMFPEVVPLDVDFSQAVFEDDLLTQILMELQLNTMQKFAEEKTTRARQKGLLEGKTAHHIVFEAVKDRMTTLLRPMQFSCGKGITISAVFAARIITDSNNLLGDDVDRSYYGLRKLGALSERMLELKWSDEGRHLRSSFGLMTTSEELYRDWLNKEIGTQAIKLSGRTVKVIKLSKMVGIKYAILEASAYNSQQATNLPHGVAANAADNAAGFDIRLDPIILNKEYTFLYNKVPLYSGLEALKLTIGMEKLGIDLANAMCSVAAAAHLYNAVQQVGLLQESWALMDRTIQNHINDFFSGDLPTTGHLIFQRFGICTGVPVDSFARNRRVTHRKLPTKIFRNVDKILQGSKSSALIEAYFDDEISGEALVLGLVSNNRTRRHQSKDTHSGMLQMLRDFNDCLLSVTPKIEDNLIPLARQCDNLLLKVREGFKEKLDTDHFKNGFEYGEVCKQWNMITVLSIFEDAFSSSFSANGTKSRKKPSHLEQIMHDSSQTSGKLQIAAEIMREFLPQANAVVDIPPFDVVAETLASLSTEPSARSIREARRIIDLA